MAGGWEFKGLRNLARIYLFYSTCIFFTTYFNFLSNTRQHTRPPTHPPPTHHSTTEARKSPVVDGKVQRTPDGKEVRFPVLLSPAEKEIARAVTLTFGQRVCGFDLLRTERGRSYVCDVNGWSVVKNSHKVRFWVVVVGWSEYGNNLITQIRISI